MNADLFRSRRRLLGAALGATASTVLLPWRQSMAQANKTPDPFYNHAFDELAGASRDMREFLGKPLVFNFWATWCPPCVKEMPDLNALNEQHPDVAFLGLAMDSDSNVRKFLEKVPVDYDILMAGKGGMRLMRELGNRQGGLPFTVVFDAQGRLSRRILGQVKPDVLDGYIRDLDLS